MRRISIIAALLISAAGPTQLRAGDPWEEMKRDAENNPDKIVGCGVGDMTSVYIANAICFDIMKLHRDRKIESSAAGELLKTCGSISASACLVMLKEVRHLSDRARTVSKYVLIDECANDLEKELPGNGKPQYLNACNEIMEVFGK